MPVHRVHIERLDTEVAELESAGEEVVTVAQVGVGAEWLVVTKPKPRREIRRASA